MKVTKLTNNKIMAILVITIFLLSSRGMMPTVAERFESHDNANGIPDFDTSSFLDQNSNYPSDFNVGDFLSDNENIYNQVWDPWVSKAAIHAVATYQDSDYLALAGGYLYDNEIHLYRWNTITETYDLVWEIGDGIFQSDVTSLAFADTDYNDLVEIIAGGEDGRLYVFEQRHLYDPVTNMENQFDLVWESERLGRIFDVHVYDSDGDFRQDIIVGTHDTVRWFEYDTHGNYPFTQDHYIEYREVFSYQLDSQITAIDDADTDSDGLPEIVIGSKSGEIVLMENNGTSIPINGQWFPIMQDNSYQPIWNSGNSIRRAVSDMQGGDIDNDNHKELLIAVQGQGAYVLDTIEGEFGVYRLQREFESWEANPIEIYPLDVYTDIMLNSSSKDNSDDNELPIGQADVYYQNITSSWPEPLNYTAHGNFIIYPYSSYSVMNQRSQPDGRYTYFDGTKNNPNYANPWAIYDWGNDEAAAGNGIPTLWDVKIWVESLTVAPENINISLSNDNVNWYNVNSTSITTGDNGTHYFYLVEVDPTLANASLDAYRYMRFELLSNQLLKVDVFETRGYDKPIYDALSVEIGELTFKNDVNPTTVGFIGTIDGAVLGVIWNATEGMYQIAWDSWVDERWKLETNIFDLALINQKSRFPSWMYRADTLAQLDLTAGLPDGGYIVDYAVDNFYNYHQDTVTDWIFSSSNGNLFVYQQYTPTSKPIYNAALTNMLFGGGTTSDDDLDTTLNSISVRSDFIGVSLIPADAYFNSPTFGYDFDPIRNGYILAVSYWDGTMGNLGIGNRGTPDDDSIDVQLWYLENDFNEDTTNPAGVCGAYGLPVCSYFRPLKDILGNPSYDNVGLLSTLEVTGQIKGSLMESTWMPKIFAADMIGTPNRDLILSNGKVHLLETLYTKDQIEYDDQFNLDVNANFQQVAQLYLNANTETIYGYLNFAVRGDYFKELNDDSKGRHWTNVQPVDFNGDGIMDIIASFSRYTDTYFGFYKPTMGVTYWENQGSTEEPRWVERIHGITNTDPEAGFRSQNFTDPMLIYDTYSPTLLAENPQAGYSWMTRVDKPSRMIMFKPDFDNIFNGKFVPFYAEYDQPTSLMAATYPEVQRLDINLQYIKQGGNTEINYGFHIFETWDNSEELNGWTLSMTTADMDEDGDNEIIVGDFNNNIYVFEHLSNNSYGRAYRSFDVNRTIETDLSPYYHENFGGIEGTFTRTIFDHVEKLIGGYDLNNNSRQEFIGATENMIFIFESMSSPTGRVRDDSYQLIGTIDILNYPALMDMEQDDLKITALTAADDLSGDGRRELIVGVTSALLIFEVDKAPTPDYLEAGEFNVNEIFFADSYDLLGLYDLPGNYLIHPDYKIDTLLVEDLDQDGYMDIVVAGTDRSSARPIWDGFVSILEWRGSGLRVMVEPEMFDRTTEFNPINDLAVDDSDFDNKKELIIGHNQGVDIYEVTGDNSLELREVISANPHYQIPDRHYAFQADVLEDSKDVARAPAGYLTMVYTVNISDQTYLLMATSANDGESWVLNGVIPYTQAATTVQNGIGALDPYITGIEEPSVTYSGNTLWLSFVERYDYFGSTYYIYYVVKNPTVAGPNNAYPVYWDVHFTRTTRTPSMRVFNINGFEDSNYIGVVWNQQYTMTGSVDITGPSVNIGRAYIGTYNSAINTATSDFYYIDRWERYEFSNGTVTDDQFKAESLDVVQLREHGGLTDHYGLVFSGYPYSESLSLDLDLFYVELSINSTSNWLWNGTRPNRMGNSGISSYYPSITQELYTENLLVTYEESAMRPYGGLFSTWSNDGGITWNGPYDMSHPLGLDMPLLFEAVPSQSKETYQVVSKIGMQTISSFSSRRPIVVAGTEAGFSMVYSAYAGIVDETNKVGLCGSQSNLVALAKDHANCNPIVEFDFLTTLINPFSNFSWYQLGAANKIAVGDTDRDNRHEIVVASGKQAFLYEFKSNSETSIMHEQKWVSDPYERDITDIGISDGNGNGLPEIVITSERGVVNTYEVVDILMGQSSLLYPKLEDSITGVVGQGIETLAAVDLDDDGYDDLLYSTSDGELHAISGIDYAPIWSQTGLSSASSGAKSVLVAHAGDVASRDDIITGLNGYSIGTATWDLGASAPTVQDLVGYDAVILVGSVVMNDPIATGDALADYVDLGGTVIATSWTYVGMWSAQGRLRDSGYLPLIAANNDNDLRSYAGDSDHPLMAGVTTFDPTFTMFVDVTLGAKVLASYSDGTPLLARKGNVFTVNAEIFAGMGDEEVLFYNLVSSIPDEPVFRKAQVIHNSANGLPVRIAFFHDNQLGLIDINTGTVINSITLNADTFKSMEIGELASNGYDDIIFGTLGGEVRAVSGSDLSQIWTTDASAILGENQYNHGIRDVRVGYFSSNTTLDVAAVGGGDIVRILSGNTGNLIRDDQLNGTTSRAGITVLDLDEDGYDDYIVGDQTQFAFNGATGEQFWNNSISLYTTKPYTTFQTTADPVVMDVNEDGVLDFVATHKFGPGGTAVAAIDGSSGDVIWTYELSNVDVMSTGLMDLGTLNTSISQEALILNVQDFSYSSSFVVALDPSNGLTIAGIPQETHGKVAIVADLLGHSRPVIVSGDDNGGITVHSLWEGQPPVPRQTILELEEDPFFFLGDEFTRRTQYYLRDITGDGVDDTFVIDDNYVGVGDTYRLLEDPNYNEVIWSVTDYSFGRFLGFAEFGDVNGTFVQDELVVAFANKIVVFDITPSTPASKRIIASFDYHLQNDDNGRTRDFSMILIDADDNGVMDIMFSRVLYWFGFPISQIAWVEGGSWVIVEEVYVPFGDGITFTPVNLDNAGRPEIVLNINYAYNPLVNLVAALTSDLTSVFGGIVLPLFGLPPITEIAGGDFNSTFSGEEFILFFEMSKLSLPDFFVDLFGAPTLFIQLAWNSTSNSLQIPLGNLLGLAPTGAPTKKYSVIDYAGETHMIVESSNGDRFDYDFSTSGSNKYIMSGSGILQSVAVPYARQGFVVGNFQCGDVIAISAANAFSCYDVLDFTNAVETAGLTIDFGVIQDLVVADLDDDTFDDLLITSFTGYVWVLRSNPPANLLELSGDAELSFGDRLLEFVGSPAGFIVTTAIFGSVIAMPIMRRRKIIKV